jgi:protocatechuate 3,4-dioxygenase beta subunit
MRTLIIMLFAALLVLAQDDRDKQPESESPAAPAKQDTSKEGKQSKGTPEKGNGKAGKNDKAKATQIQLTLTVVDAQGSPVRNAQVILWSGNNPGENKNTNANGKVSFRARSLNVTIRITADRMKPYQMSHQLPAGQEEAALTIVLEKS